MTIKIDDLEKELTLSKEKKEFMESFMTEAANFKDKNEGMIFFQNKLKEARDAGISFSNTDILLLASRIKQSANAKEQMLIEKILQKYNIK